MTSHIPRGSKYPIFKDSGPRNHTLNGFWGPESSNIGYLDPQGYAIIIVPSVVTFRYISTRLSGRREVARAILNHAYVKWYNAQYNPAGLTGPHMFRLLKSRGSRCLMLLASTVDRVLSESNGRVRGEQRLIMTIGTSKKHVFQGTMLSSARGHPLMLACIQCRSNRAGRIEEQVPQVLRVHLQKVGGRLADLWFGDQSGIAVVLGN